MQPHAQMASVLAIGFQVPSLCESTEVCRGNPPIRTSSAVSGLRLSSLNIAFSAELTGADVWPETFHGRLANIPSPFICVQSVIALRIF
jgi:hypothetical protein